MQEFPQDIHQFLQQHWQREPCLFRNAFPDWRDPLSPEELAGLACEPEFESRLVIQGDSAPQWRVEHGPFPESRFMELGEQDWTLLVQDVDKQLPEIADLLGMFRFIPDWRLDDVMISFAATHGGVGPHWDEYDVFLIQGQGRRRWQLDRRNVRPDNLLPDLDLRVMAEFETDDEWILEPGDMLYLPPNVGHWGTALEPCLTYSVGFRAPDGVSLASLAFDRWLESAPRDNPRYTDAGRQPCSNPHAIDPQELDRLRSLARTWLQPDDDWLNRAILEQLTTPKAGLDPFPAEEALDDWREQTLIRHTASRVVSHRDDAGRTLLAVGGLSCPLSAGEEPLVHLLASSDPVDGGALLASCRTEATKTFVESLLQAGHLQIIEP